MQTFNISHRGSDESLRFAIEYMSDGIWEINLVTGEAYYNDRWFEQLGYIPGEFEHTLENFFNLVYPQDKGELLQQINEYMQSGGEYNFISTFRLRSKSGTYRTILSRGKAVEINMANGNVIRMVGMHSDITELQSIQTALFHTNLELKAILEKTLIALGSTIQFNDPYTHLHQTRVGKLCNMVAHDLGMTEAEIHGITTAARLHDIGKLGIPKELLTKPIKLLPIEYSLIKEHAVIGFEMLKDVPFKSEVPLIILQHHEKLDGSGYPYCLSGDDIIPGARILTACDVIEAMGTHRPYRPKLPLHLAVDELQNTDKYDSDVVTSLLKIVDGLDLDAL